MTTGVKIAIAITAAAVVGVGGYFIWKTITDGKEREVRDMEKEKYTSLGDAIELGRKNHPALSEWFDSLTLNQTKMIEDGWAVMTDLQKDKIIDAMKKSELPQDVEDFFKKKGYKG